MGAPPFVRGGDFAFVAWQCAKATGRCGTRATNTAPSDSRLAEGVDADTHHLLAPVRRFDYIVVSLLPSRLRGHAKPVLVYARSGTPEGEWGVMGIRRLD